MYVLLTGPLAIFYIVKEIYILYFSPQTYIVYFYNYAHVIIRFLPRFFTVRIHVGVFLIIPCLVFSASVRDLNALVCSPSVSPIVSPISINVVCCCMIFHVSEPLS